MKNKSGALGEGYTAAYLQKKGYQILARNFHSRFGELDIVAANKTYIAFVEVKTRAKNALVSPLEAVTAGKQQKLILTAQYYLQTKGGGQLQPRFDVAALIMEGGKILEFTYLEHAFST